MKKFSVLFALMALLGLNVACTSDRQMEEEPIEDTAEEMEDAGEEAGDEIEDAVD